jgi:hypothetical protein
MHHRQKPSDFFKFNVKDVRMCARVCGLNMTAILFIKSPTHVGSRY